MNKNIDLSKSFGKLFKKTNSTYLLIGFGVLLILFLLYRLSMDSNSYKDLMSNKSTTSQYTSNSINRSGMAKPASSYNNDNSYSDVSSVSKVTTTNSSYDTNMNNSDLLPMDSNSEFNQLNPNNDLKNVNYLDAGIYNRIDTVGSSLKNANLQLRSEPPNPQVVVSPWNNTTIGPDLNRLPLEIGQY